MFTRQNNTVGKALRNTQEKGKAFRIRMNAMLKKAMKDNKELRLMYGHLKHESDRFKADRDMLLIELTETEEERLELIKKQEKSKKCISKLKNEIMMLKKQVKKCRTTLPRISWPQWLQSSPGPSIGAFTNLTFCYE